MDWIHSLTRNLKKSTGDVTSKTVCIPKDNGHRQVSFTCAAGTSCEGGNHIVRNGASPGSILKLELSGDSVRIVRHGICGMLSCLLEAT